MKTVFINGSPKKKFSASAHLQDVQRMFVKGEKVKEHLRGRSDYQRILEKLAGADNVIFCLPLYVDGIPSHVLSFLEVLEAFCRENRLGIRVYVLSNGGFIEGDQSRVLMAQFENFCHRAGLIWGGGIGVGGGVMLNVLGIVFRVFVGLLIVDIGISGIVYGNWLSRQAFLNFLVRILWILFFNLGVVWYTMFMGRAVNRRRYFGTKYTRILIPAVLFIVIADIFFVISAILQGGFFKGWLKEK